MVRIDVVVGLRFKTIIGPEKTNGSFKSVSEIANKSDFGRAW
jgi:hypothetical protein